MILWAWAELMGVCHFKKIMKGSGTMRSGSLVVTLILCIIIITLFYFYWSLSGQLKMVRTERNTVKSELRYSEGERNKMNDRMKTLDDNIRTLHSDMRLMKDQKSKLESTVEDLNSQLVRWNLY